MSISLLQPPSRDKGLIDAGDAGFSRAKADQPLGFLNPVVVSHRDSRGAGPVLGLQPDPRRHLPLSFEGVGNDSQRFRGQILPVEILQQEPLIRSAALVQKTSMLPHGFDRGETHDGEGQNDQGDAREGRSDPAPSQIAYAQEKSGDKSLPGADLNRLHMPCLPLETDHLSFESEKDDQRHHERKPHDEKGKDHHHGVIGELKGRMDFIDQGNQQKQDSGECDDPLVDVRVAKKQPLQAKGKGDEQGDVKQDPEKDILLRRFHVLVNAVGQSPGSSRFLAECVEFFFLKGLHSLF